MLERTLATDYFAAHLNLHLHFSTQPLSLDVPSSSRTQTMKMRSRTMQLLVIPQSMCKPSGRSSQLLMLVSLLRPQTENLLVYLTGTE